MKDKTLLSSAVACPMAAPNFPTIPSNISASCVRSPDMPSNIGCKNSFKISAIISSTAHNIASTICPDITASIIFKIGSNIPAAPISSNIQTTTSIAVLSDIPKILLKVSGTYCIASPKVSSRVFKRSPLINSRSFLTSPAIIFTCPPIELASVLI